MGREVREREIGGYGERGRGARERERKREMERERWRERGGERELGRYL